MSYGMGQNERTTHLKKWYQYDQIQDSSSSFDCFTERKKNDARSFDKKVTCTV